MASPVVDIVLRAKDEASRAINALGKSIGGLNAVARTLAPIAAGLGAIGGSAALVGIAAFKMARELSDTVERLDRLSETTGASIEQLQTLEQVFKNAGLAPESATLALSKLAKAIGNNDPLLKHLGITTRDSFEAFKQLSAIFQNSNDKAGQVAVAAKLLGRDMVQAASTVRNLGGELDSTGAKMNAAGAFIGKSADEARKMDRALDDLDISLAGVKNTIVAAVIPAVAEFAERFAQTMAENSGSIADFVKASIDAVDRMVIVLPDRLNRLSLLWLQYRLIIAETALALATGFGAVTTALGVELNTQTILISNQIDKLNGKIRDSAARWSALGLARGPDSGESFDPSTGEPTAGPTATVPERPRSTRGGVVPSGFTIDADGNLIPEKARIERLKTLVQLLREASNLSADTGFGNVAGTLPRGSTLPGLARPLDDSPDAVAAREARAASAARAASDARKSVDEQISAWQSQTMEVAESVAAIQGAVGRVKEEWLAAVGEMTSAASVLNAGFQALFSGLESGISTVFSRLTDKTQTLRSALKTIFKSIADEALRALERIAAAAIFKFVVKLLLTAAGAAVGGPAGAAAGAFTFGLATSAARPSRPGVVSRTSDPSFRINADAFARSLVSAVKLIVDGGPGGGGSRQQVTNVTNIHTYDARNAILEMTSPGGALRRANERVAVVGAY